jgi:hypothetical protein
MSGQRSPQGFPALPQNDSSTRQTPGTTRTKYKQGGYGTANDLGMLLEPINTSSRLIATCQQGFDRRHVAGHFPALVGNAGLQHPASTRQF